MCTMSCSTGKAKVKVVAIAGTTFVFCCAIAVISFKHLSPSTASLDEESNVGQSWAAGRRSFSIGLDSYKNATSCRKGAIRAILDAGDANANLREAKSCWLEFLIFYLSFPIDFGYGSHVIAFLASAWVTDGAILEMGSGWYSTPVAHRISVTQDRSVLTAESNYDWLKYFFIFSSNRHRLYYVGKSKPDGATTGRYRAVASWDDIGGQFEHWGMIFLDHAPGERRKVDMDRLRNKADLLVIHDSQPKAALAYKSQEMLASFKHRTVVGKGWSGAYTDVVSDKRPDLVRAVRIVSQWSIESLKPSKN